VRKVRADEFRAQLYNTKDDPRESKDVSAAHPEVVKELTELLNRYRDGGYSRELPPPGAKPKTTVVTLAALPGSVVLSDTLAQAPAKPWTARGDWTPKSGGLWGAQKKDDQTGATLHVPVSLTDGTIEYEIQFKGANRHSLRVEAGGRQHSFRIEVARNRLGITKNPSQGEAKDAVQPLAQKPLQLEAGQWYPVRITFKGEEVIAQVNDVVVKGSHAVVGKEKTGMNLLVFGETAGFRNLKVVR
jgi:arylsulfatase A